MRGGFPPTARGSRFAVSGSGGGGSDWQLASGHYEDAVIALEIIAPRPSLNTQSIYYKWYPGIAWEVPIVVHGGAWPYKVEIISAPSGMTIGETLDAAAFNSSGLIGQAYSVLTWSNPTSSGSPHTIEVRVTDQAGTTASVSWTLTVITSGFLFVDSVSGSDANTGTLASPWQTWNAVYGSGINDATNDNSFVIWRAGTYRTDAAPISDGERMFMRSMKPNVHVAYPGESVTWNVENSHINWDGGNDIAVVGINIIGIDVGGAYKAMQFGGNPRTLIYKNTFGAQIDAGIPGSNSAHLFFAAVTPSVTQDVAIIRNTFNNLEGTAPLETYDVSKIVVEGNALNNGAGDTSNGFFFKMRSNGVTVRANRGISTDEVFGWVWDNYQTMQDVDLSWNLFKVGTGDKIGEFGRDGGSGISLGVNLNVRRNTLVGGYLSHRDADGGANITYARNVRQHDGTQTDGVATSSFTGSPTYTAELVGTSGLVDSNGLLTGANHTSYLGIRGYEVS